VHRAAATGATSTTKTHKEVFPSSVVSVRTECERSELCGNTHALCTSESPPECTSAARWHGHADAWGRALRCVAGEGAGGRRGAPGGSVSRASAGHSVKASDARCVSLVQPARSAAVSARQPQNAPAPIEVSEPHPDASSEVSPVHCAKAPAPIEAREPHADKSRCVSAAHPSKAPPSIRLREAHPAASSVVSPQQPKKAPSPTSSSARGSRRLASAPQRWKASGQMVRSPAGSWSERRRVHPAKAHGGSTASRAQPASRSAVSAPQSANAPCPTRASLAHAYRSTTGAAQPR